MESIERRKRGMNKLKWYDFLGALILLFSVTKSAIQPQNVSGHPKSYDSTSLAPATNSIQIAPREAALSQFDMLSPATMDLGAPEIDETQDERLKAVFSVEVAAPDAPRAKSLPKSAPRRVNPSAPPSELLLTLCPGAYSPVPAFIC